MDIKILLVGLFYTAIIIWDAYVLDSQAVITSEHFKKHTIKMNGILRYLFIFERRSQRKYFLKFSVIMNIIIYIFFFIVVIVSFLEIDWKYLELIGLYLMGILGILFAGFSGFYSYQSYKYKRNLPKNKDKTFWEYMRTKNR